MPVILQTVSSVLSAGLIMRETQSAAEPGAARLTCESYHYILAR